MGTPTYSELTMGDDASIECLKDKWKMELYEGTDIYRKNILLAKSCGDFKLADTDT